MEIKVLRNVQEANDAIAAENRRRLKERGAYALNLIASPGAGKTTLLERTLDGLRGELSMAVIEGDIAGSADAERIGRHGVPVVQINTGGDCHLNANMVRSALESLPLEGVQLLFIENVGNLVCPASYDLGEHLRVVVSSTTEGEDKPLKYPAMFRRSQALVLNKIDLLPYLPYNLDEGRAMALRVNPSLEVFETSCTSGAGIPEFCEWVVQKMNETPAA